jgi:hypothetical protein
MSKQMRKKWRKMKKWWKRKRWRKRRLKQLAVEMEDDKADVEVEARLEEKKEKGGGESAPYISLAMAGRMMAGRMAEGECRL